MSRKRGVSTTIASPEELKQTIWFKEGHRPQRVADPLIPYVFKRISPYVTWLLLHTPITANQVTLLSIAVTLIGGGIIVLAGGNLGLTVLGIILMLLGELLDCVDGEIARYRKTVSLTGEFIDLWGHQIEGASIVGFITLAAYDNLPSRIVVALGLIAMMAFSSLALRTRIMLLAKMLQKREGIAQGSTNQNEKESGTQLQTQPQKKVDFGLGLHPTVVTFITFGYPLSMYMFVVAGLLDVFVPSLVLLGQRGSFMSLLLVWCVITLVPKEIFYVVRTVRLRRVDKGI